MVCYARAEEFEADPVWKRYARLGWTPSLAWQIRCRACSKTAATGVRVALRSSNVSGVSVCIIHFGTEQGHSRRHVAALFRVADVCTAGSNLPLIRIACVCDARVPFRCFVSGARNGWRWWRWRWRRRGRRCRRRRYNTMMFSPKVFNDLPADSWPTDRLYRVRRGHWRCTRWLHKNSLA